MNLETERLILRPWREEDAETLYEYARDPEVGPAAGWLPHADVEDSRNIIKRVLSKEGTCAVILKALGDKPVGSVGVFPTDAETGKGEPEIGYWIGKPFWGQGYIPEAVRALQEYVFTETDARRCWCAHFEGNDKSRRVIEKCGFTYQYTGESGPWPSGGMRVTHFYCVTKEEWLTSFRESK